MFVDTHCHLYKEYYDDIKEVIQNSKSNGIIKFKIGRAHV